MLVTEDIIKYFDTYLGIETTEPLFKEIWDTKRPLSIPVNLKGLYSFLSEYDHYLMRQDKLLKYYNQANPDYSIFSGTIYFFDTEKNLTLFRLKYGV